MSYHDISIPSIHPAIIHGDPDTVQPHTSCHHLTVTDQCVYNYNVAGSLQVPDLTPPGMMTGPPDGLENRYRVQTRTGLTVLTCHLKDTWPANGLVSLVHDSMPEKKNDSMFSPPRTECVAV
jgi:hypothetical protein